MIGIEALDDTTVSGATANLGVRRGGEEEMAVSRCMKMYEATSCVGEVGVKEVCVTDTNLGVGDRLDHCRLGG